MSRVLMNAPSDQEREEAVAKLYVMLQQRMMLSSRLQMEAQTAWQISWTSIYPSSSNSWPMLFCGRTSSALSRCEQDV